MALDAGKAASSVAVRNGQFLGLDVDYADSKLVILPLPWDVTTSYRPGTVNGPQAVIDASYQLDLYSPWKNEVWSMPLHTLPISQEWVQKSAETRKLAAEIIEFLEEGGDISSDTSLQKKITQVNSVCQNLHQWSYQKSKEMLKAGKKVLALGGDHSVSLGPIRAAAEHYPDLSVLHFDAHADLREAYEGFQDSHASIMFNVLQNTNIKKLVQVGIRDVSQVEIDLIDQDPRVQTFFDWQVKEREANGETWSQIAKEIVSHLSPNVYISFDIDGLDPKLCPNTGTPVPGGLELFEAGFLIREIQKSGRKLVGADLVEVAPGLTGGEVANFEADEWDGNVGARVLFQILTAMSF